MKFNKTKPIALGIAFTLALTPIHAITYADTNSDSASINVQTAQTEYKSLRKESKVVQTKKQYGDFSLTALSFASISIFSG